MGQRVAILHTSLVFIQKVPMISDLFAELLPETEVVDIIDSQILADVQVEGITAEATARMTHMAEVGQASGADVIFSNCSSLGPTIDTARQAVDIPIIKIDDAMALEAATQASTIGVLATVPTTLDPTIALIEEKAADLGKSLTIYRGLSEGAFDMLMSGDTEGHDQLVLESAQSLAPKVEILVLAQASMTRLAPMLSEKSGLKVFTSPRLGVQSVKEYLDSLA
jgi:Asp/Glu/hydantoin racemase